MKPNLLLSSKAWMTFAVACIGSAVLLSSCAKKNDPQPEPVGEAKIRFVNTVQGSAAQDFYVNDNKKTTTAVAYGSASEYVTITSGSNTLKAYDAGTTTLKGQSQAYDIPIGISATAFFYQAAGGNFGVFAVGDDQTAPATGKAKVRFINVNSVLPTTSVITVTVQGETTSLIPSLAYGDLNIGYKTVDPGAKFVFTANGVTTAPVLDGGIVAGKNYTIWIDGSSSALTGHVILQN